MPILNNTITRRGVTLGIAALWASTALPAHALTASSAEGLVTRAVKDVQDAINSGRSERDILAQFRKIFLKYADVPTVARSVVGQSWRKASKADQRAYVNAFTGYLSRKYGRQFNDFKGAKFTVLGSKDAGSKGFLVRSQVKTTNSGTPFKVDWQVSDRSGKVLIFNMFIEGISMLTTERGEIRALLEKSGGDVGAMAKRLDNMG